MKESNNLSIGYVSSIETLGLVDGPGVRIVVFMQGCNLRCAYCHNPETWIKNNYKLTYTPSELVNFILRYKNYILNGGVTFSGGEPLLQGEFIYNCVKMLKKFNIHTAIDTSGIGNYFDKLLDEIDLVILDIKEIEDKKFKKLTGGNLVDLQNFLIKVQQKNKKLWLRHVILPNYNDNFEYIDKFYEFIKDIKNVEKVELLGYHNTAINKYKELKINYKLNYLQSLSENKLNILQCYLNKKLAKNN